MSLDVSDLLIFPSERNPNSITLHEGRMDSAGINIIRIILHVPVDKENCTADVGTPLIPTLDGLGKN